MTVFQKFLLRNSFLFSFVSLKSLKSCIKDSCEKIKLKGIRIGRKAAGWEFENAK